MNYLSYFEYIECQRFSRGGFHTVERSENLVTFLIFKQQNLINCI